MPGGNGVVPNKEEAIKIAQKIRYPVIIKAAAGGGGKGMRLIENRAMMKDAFEAASREALNAFGDDAMYIEKFISEPHHVEIQVFGNGKGKAIHLWERECSIQRRHQKIWEESPAPVLNQYPKTLEAMFDAAIEISEKIHYAGAGTIEFIVDGNGNFYFLEMNTRLQVEHPVTEWIAGVDLVAWQLMLATGEFKLPQTSPERHGSAIEVRIYAEDPSTFLPAPGPIGIIEPPSGPFVRWDSAVHGRSEISMYYDPMIAKLSVWGPDRETAMNRLQLALSELRVEPPKKPDGTVIGSLRTNLPLLRKLVQHKVVRIGHTTTDLIQRHPELISGDSSELSREAAIAISLFQLMGCYSSLLVFVLLVL